MLSSLDLASSTYCTSIAEKILNYIFRIKSNFYHTRNKRTWMKYRNSSKTVQTYVDNSHKADDIATSRYFKIIHTTCIAKLGMIMEIKVNNRNTTVLCGYYYRIELYVHEYTKK